MAGKCPRVQVGSDVLLRFGLSTLRGTVVEDRGRLGVGGRRVWRVRVPMEYGGAMTLEVPEGELRLAPDVA